MLSRTIMLAGIALTAFAATVILRDNTVPLKRLKTNAPPRD